jgi:hypothetical protein
MAFMQSQPKIYEKMQLEGTLKEWDSSDLWSLLAPLQQFGYSWDPATATMRIQGPIALNANTPWIHHKNLHTKHCAKDHSISFNCFNCIHPRCLECWKTVVTPKTFIQLLQLQKVQKKLDLPSKCGIELRDYTPKFYGGYFYANSLDEGREQYEMVVDAVRDEIGDDIADEVILKRACTEFEMVKGPSPFWHNTDDENKILDIIEAYVDVPRHYRGQSSIVTNHVRMKWAVWAHMNGDMTYQDYNDGRSLFPGYVSYHKGDIGAIKHDLAVARAEAKRGIPLQVSHDFINFTAEFADSNGVKMGDLIHALGANDVNPLGVFEAIRQVPEENKGDHLATAGEPENDGIE